MYILYYMDKKYEFDSGIPFQQMSVHERHQNILRILASVFQEEAEDWLDTRPKDTKEGETLNDIYDMFRSLEGDLDDDLDDD